MRSQSIITNNLLCLLDMPQSAGSDPLSQTVQGRKRAAVIVSPLHKLRAIVDGDGAVILDIERDLLSSLNPTGAYVWQGLERGETLERIIANLAREAVYGLFILQ